MKWNLYLTLLKAMKQGAFQVETLPEMGVQRLRGILKVTEKPKTCGAGGKVKELGTLTKLSSRNEDRVGTHVKMCSSRVVPRAFS